MSLGRYLDDAGAPEVRSPKDLDDLPELLPADYDRTPVEHERFLHQLRQEWIKDDPQRLRDVAAVVLFVNGFTVREIGPLLALNAGHVTRLIQKTTEALAVHFRPV